MNAEYLLDAIGFVDDDLLREAEEYRRPRQDYRPWIGLAASFAVVLTLGYALTHLGMGGGSAAPENQASGGAAGTPAGSYGGAEGPPLEEYRPPASAEGPDSSMQGGGSTPADPAAPQEPGAAEGDYCAAIMVDGVLYHSTGEAVPGEPDPSVIQTASSYTDGVPEEDGQSNIAPSVQYAETDLGVVVLVEEEWILFEPVE